MLLAIGEVRRVNFGVKKSRTNKETGEVREWDQDEVLLLAPTDDYPTKVKLSKDFDRSSLPARGEDVAFEVFAQGFGREAVLTAVRVVDMDSDGSSSRSSGSVSSLAG